MTCPECGGSAMYVVDGRAMDRYEILALPRAPRTIERRERHDRTCPRMRLLVMEHSVPAACGTSEPMAVGSSA